MLVSVDGINCGSVLIVPGADELNAAMDELEARLRRVGDPIMDAWRPGVSSEGIRASEQQLGFELPDEARAWWMRHNGVLDLLDFASKDSPLSLEEAVTERSASVTRAQELAAEEWTVEIGWTAQTPWPPAWVPFLRDSGAGPMVLDCSAVQAASVYRADPEDDPLEGYSTIR